MISGILEGVKYLNHIINQKNLIETITFGFLFFLLLLLMFDHYEVIYLNRLPFTNNIQFTLWMYVLINVGITGAVKFSKEIKNPICPRCRGKMNAMNLEYECEKCGKLIFVRE
ncbi:hypothetical protein [Methanolapillus millepedarum]|uniref:Uncharacterized protein n=1 Tax=Methanolapillus millepedarum TaxID=3028296 RepID=A0AA96VC92_9EURY|nr:hypothetical protein MsAc7_11130 [Methanosarcinaceae archaeon Ac7]